MNPDVPHEEMEARITALLLGELSAEEAAVVRRAMVEDPELSRLHDRLKYAIELVRVAAADSAQEIAAPAAPLRLSESRRQQVLESFKTIAPEQFSAPR